MNVEASIQEWQKKIKLGMIWSDPARPEELNSFVESTKFLYTQDVFDNLQLSIYQKRQPDNLQQKSVFCKSLKFFGSGLGLTKEEAERMIVEKNQK